MLARIRFLLTYYLFWIVWFQLARLIFLVYNAGTAEKLTIAEKALSFLYGMRMDLSVAAYFLLPVCLFVIASLFVPFFRKPLIYNIYSYILLFFVLLITTADLEVYRNWGFRIDTTPLRYLASPREAWASVSHLPVFWIFSLFMIGWILLCYLIRRLIKGQVHLLGGTKKKIVALVLLVFFTTLLILPIRGGLQLTPMNQSMVYFSKKNFANLTAVNATWNFLYGIVEGNSSKNPYHYLEPAKAKAIVRDLYLSQGLTDTVLRNQNPNVIVIIWESFTKKATDTTLEGREITPRFNELKKQGLYFSNVYASGDRTDKGLAAVLAGYPALNNFSIIRYPQKSAKLPTLSRYFKERNYHTSFYYGGETEFANIKSFLLQSQFDQLVDKNNFAAKDQNSKWGAHDGAVAARITNDLQGAVAPFFVSWLTLSSHEPFETPIATYFKGKDHLSLFSNAMHYADGVIYDFVQECSKQPWWSNTLLIIVADHGHHAIPPSTTINNFKIPMLWLGGALKVGGVIDKVISQIDIATTLTSQLGQKTPLYPFSKNIFDTTSRPWAYFSFNDGFGLVQPSGTFIFDNVGKQVVSQKGTVTSKDIEAGKALQQEIFQNYLGN